MLLGIEFQALDTLKLYILFSSAWIEIGGSVQIINHVSPKSRF